MLLDKELDGEKVVEIMILNQEAEENFYFLADAITVLLHSSPYIIFKTSLSGKEDIWSLWVEDEEDREYFWNTLGKYIPKEARFEEVAPIPSSSQYPQGQGKGEDQPPIPLFMSSSSDMLSPTPSFSLSHIPSLADVQNKIEFPDIAGIRERYEQKKERGVNQDRFNLVTNMNVCVIFFPCFHVSFFVCLLCICRNESIQRV